MNEFPLLSALDAAIRRRQDEVDAMTEIRRKTADRRPIAEFTVREIALCVEAMTEAVRAQMSTPGGDNAAH